MSPDSDPVVTVVRLDLDGFVVAAADAGADAGLAVKRLSNEVAASIDRAQDLDPAGFARLVLLEGQGELTTSQAREVLKRLLEQGGDPETIAKELGFEAIPASEVAGVLDEVIAANQAEWRRFVAGEDKLQGLFIGQVKAATGGKADPKAVATSLRARREQEQQLT